MFDRPVRRRQAHFDPTTIHRFDCTEEHMGGAGSAGLWLNEKGTEFGDVWLGQVRRPRASPPCLRFRTHRLDLL